MYFHEKKQTRPGRRPDLRVEAFMLLLYRFWAHLHSVGFGCMLCLHTTSCVTCIIALISCHSGVLALGSLVPAYSQVLWMASPAASLSGAGFSGGGRVLVGSACLFGNLIFVKHAISHCRPWSVLICSPENVLQQIFFSKFLCSSAAQRDSSPILTCHYWIPLWWSICNMTQSDLLPRGLFGPWETHTSCQKVRVEPAFSFALHFNYSNSPLSFTQEQRNTKQM